MLTQDDIDKLLSSLSSGDAQGAETNAQAVASQPTQEAASRSTGEALSNYADASGGGFSFDFGEGGANPKKFKVYNFKRPDKFPKEHLRALQNIHENFSRLFSLTLTAYLRMPVEIDVISVDQLTYDEVIRSMPRAVQVFILEMHPLPGQVLLGFGLDITTSIIDRLLGGPGHASTRHRELSHVEQLLIRKMVERGLNKLEEAWQNLMPLHINIMGMEESYTLIQIAPPSEIVALITFEIHLGNQESGLFNLCIPFPVLEDVVQKLSNQHMFTQAASQVNYVDQLKILTRLHASKVAFNVLLGASQVTVRDLLQLEAGDVIRLDSEVTQDLVACVNGNAKFLCRPGVHRKKLSVCITDTVESPDLIFGFGSLTKDMTSAYDMAG